MDAVSQSVVVVACLLALTFQQRKAGKQRTTKSLSSNKLLLINRMLHLYKTAVITGACLSLLIPLVLLSSPLGAYSGECLRRSVGEAGRLQLQRQYQRHQL